MPFIVEGFEQGDRAVHIVDPESRDAHIERLNAVGIDASAAAAARQLEVLTWPETYMRGGTFDGTAQLAYIRQTMDEGPALGYPWTRLIGSTEWARDADTASALIAYEDRVDALLSMLPGVAVCTYDLNHHTARTIADVLDVHPIAVVGGVLRASRSPARLAPRDRLLAAASYLFSEHGIQATGVDALIARAGVAKATLYRHYPSKDDLVAAWLRDTRTRWFDHVRARVDAHHADGTAAVPLFFEALADWLEFDGYRGCPYLSTASEIKDPTHPARLIVADYLGEIENWFIELLGAAGAQDPRSLGAQLHALVAGSISLAAARRSPAPVLSARDAAVSLLRDGDCD